MTTTQTRPQSKPTVARAAQRNVSGFGAGRYRREIQWGLRHAPSQAERRRAARRAA